MITMMIHTALKYLASLAARNADGRSYETTFLKQILLKLKWVQFIYFTITIPFFCNLKNAVQLAIFLYIWASCEDGRFDILNQIGASLSYILY